MSSNDLWASRERISSLPGRISEESSEENSGEWDSCAKAGPAAAARIKDRIRFSLNDESGELRFTRFDIIDVMECRHVEAKLRSYLIHRSLSKVDVSEIRRLSSPGDAECMQAVLDTIAECQDLFAMGLKFQKTD